MDCFSRVCLGGKGELMEQKIETYESEGQKEGGQDRF